MDISKAAAAYQQTGGMKTEPVKLDNSSEQDELGPSFKELVSEGLESAKGAGYEGEIQSVEALANKTELHELVTAVSNAELTLNTVVAVRDRMISAYQDIMKMPV